MRVSPFLAGIGQNVRNRHLLLVDVLLLPVAVFMAFALRLNQAQLAPYLRTMLIYALVAPLIKIPILASLGFYSRFWRYAGIDELLLLAGGVLLGAIAQGVVFLVIQTAFPLFIIPPVPRSIPPIDLLLALTAIAAPRLALQVWSQNNRRLTHTSAMPQVLQRILIAGAGEAGALVLRELRANPQTGLVPVGFIDDDTAKHGVLLQKVRVLGGRETIPRWVREKQVDQVIIAMPSASGKAIREIVDICEAAGVRARIVPAIYELLGGTVRLNQLRDVEIEDLLRREPVRTDTAQVGSLIRGRRVLVTGAGGSIGSELCRQILRFGPAELVLLGHGENSIFDIHNELKDWCKVEGTRLKVQLGTAGPVPATLHLPPIIADVRDADRLAAVFAARRPEIVFHAAAHKHVPLMEDNVEDAVTNNVLGTRNVVEASIAAGVGHFVLISTDKAVNPTSVMGATKRVAELIVQDAARRTGRAFVAVRFGNVLGSRGSVVPHFQRQIAAGGPVTVTHPEMRRYFMTIPEAVQLVLQAAALGVGGEVFVLDMGEPVRIDDLARDLIRLSGLEPGRDIEIRYTGLRPGEKLYEELFGGGERHERTQHEKIFVSVNGVDGHESSNSLAPAQLAGLVLAAQRGETEVARQMLTAVVAAGRSEATEDREVPAR